jgi:hypothetical protein
MTIHLFDLMLFQVIDSRTSNPYYINETPGQEGDDDLDAIPIVNLGGLISIIPQGEFAPVISRY